jgi:hypothetical protein
VLLSQYCARDKIENNEIGGACRAYEEGNGVYRILVGTPKGKRPIGKLRCRWENNIKLDLQEVGCELWTGLSWLMLRTGWRALVNAVINLRVP